MLLRYSLIQFHSIEYYKIYFIYKLIVIKYNIYEKNIMYFSYILTHSIYMVASWVIDMGMIHKL